MLEARDISETYGYLKLDKGVLFPPCAISIFVRFEDGVCTLSGETSCRHCVRTTKDLLYIRMLTGNDNFGYA